MIFDIVYTIVGSEYNMISVGFTPLEPGEPGELVRLVFGEFCVVRLVFGSPGFWPADRPAENFLGFGNELLKRNRK